jgi:lipopolysaccharide transport system ATP-binding protein
LKPILEIKEISKKYQIEGNKKPYLSLRENIFSFLKPAAKKEEFWALRHLSFDIMPGETLGIMGRNGAGKSTLLKILSKITPPTEGRIIGRGRGASLLEVGTGFHSELSGRENVYMNGSILGMRRQEITKNFDAIVDFAGVQKFIDTPLKHYSSGMQLRLAFAVAAFLENEILIIDEVLAVGDAEFQKKCMGKMKDISGQGRTVLFVSHNIAAIQNLCSNAMLLEKGKLKAKGKTAEVAAIYSGGGTEDNTWLFEFPKSGDLACATKLEILDLSGRGTSQIPVGKPWKIVITFEVMQNIDNLVVGLGMVNNYETPVRNSWNRAGRLTPGIYKAVFIEDKVMLASGGYRLIVGLSIGKHSIQYIDDNINFTITNVVENPDEALINNSNAIFVNQMEMQIEKC